MVENTVSPSSIAMSHKVMMTLHASGCKIQKIFQHINKRNALQQTSYNSSSNIPIVLSVYGRTHADRKQSFSKLCRLKVSLGSTSPHAMI